MEIGNKNLFVMDQFAARHALHPGGSRKTDEFDTALENAREAGTGKQSPESAGEDQKETLEEKDYRAFLLEKMEEMRVNIRKGTIQPKFQIGSEAYTQEEWKKLLEKLDAVEESLREQIEEEIATAKEKADAKEAETDTVIVTRADGARIMMIKTPFGEMSVELSKPDDSMAHGEMISKVDPDDFQSDSSAFSLAATESSQK